MVTLTATPVGAGTFLYQWQQGTDGAGWQDIVGARSASYAATATAPGRMEYRAQVQRSQTGCSVSTTPLSLSVYNQAQVFAEASTDAVCVGGSPSVRSLVLYEGQAALSYSWQEGTAGSSTWTTLPGTGPVITPTYSAVGMRQYRVRVRPSAAGCTLINSEPVVVDFVPKPVAVARISDTLVCTGGSALLSSQVSPSIGRLSYRWQYSSNNNTWRNMAEATAEATVTAVRFGTMYYRLLLSSDAPGCGTGTVSNTLSLQVANPTIPIVGATATEVCTGVPITLQASGGDALLNTATWRWQQSTDRLEWHDLGVTVLRQFTDQPNVTGAVFYRVIAQPQQSGCGALAAQPLLVTVATPLGIALESPDETICLGGRTTLTAQLSTRINASYIWQQSPNGTTWKNIAGVSRQSYTYVPSATGVQYFRVRAKVPVNSGCNTPVSSGIPITTTNGISLSAAVSPGTWCAGSHATITLRVTGGSGNQTFQWLRGSSVSAFSPMLGETSSILSLSDLLPQATYYQVQVSDTGPGCGTEVKLPQPVLIHAAYNPVVRVRSDAAEICRSTTTTLTALVSGGTGNANYFWQQSPDGTAWEDVPIPNNSNRYPFTPADTGSLYFRVIVWFEGGTCKEAVSPAFQLSVVPDPEVEIAEVPDSVCIGASLQLQATVRNTLPMTYTWQYRNKGKMVWNNTGAPSAATYSVNANTPITREYRLLVESGRVGCESVASRVLSLTTVEKPVTQIGASATLVCPNTSVTLTAVSAGGTGNRTYQWQQAAAGSTVFLDVPQATGSTYRPVTSAAGYRSYRVLALSDGLGCGTAAPSTNTVALYVRSNCSNIDEQLPSGQGGVVVSLHPRVASLPTRVDQVAESMDIVPLPLSGKIETPKYTGSLPLLLQNSPNPFEGETRIRFYLPAPMWIRLHIQDMTGRVVVTRSGMYEAGTHEWLVAASLLGAPGMYSYSLQTDTVLLSRRMVWVE